ncbi:sensor histidine kinase [Corynebacterium bovis]|uniref:histidine kinase n=1 Tax=Corynebacterium bovis TaxID=36808 RepID=A0A426PYI5_9CORY|nr:histidine kinase [Corynebacterium bovis]MDN8578741.1 histidine kinase [Corynebacterium bovis]RRO86450.1 sensor histidine kinase [Corynebacterium bovis]RRO88713.1 sensor histidine kinase [Corynebacterium bovis]
MTASLRRVIGRPWWATAAVVAAAALAGVLTFMLSFGLWLDGQPDDVEPAGPEAAYTYATLAAWVVAVVTLPLAIHHDPREADPEHRFPGTRLTFIAGVVCTATGWSAAAGPLALVAFISMVSRRSVRWAVAAVVVTIAAVLLDLQFSPMDADRPENAAEGVTYILLVFAMTIAALLFGVARGSRREQKLILHNRATLNDALLREREEGARRDERTRIARDMHDTISHRLSLIAVHAGALEYRRDLPPDRVAETAGIIHTEAERAVADLRTVLHALRDPSPEDPRGTVRQLVEQARDAGMDVSLEVTDGLRDEDLDRLSTLAVHTIHRTAQEALTNARKHAPGQPVTVTVGRARRGVRLTVSNPTPAVPVDAPGSGTGLVGLAERAELTGGTLTVTGPGAGTMTLELEVPWS